MKDYISGNLTLNTKSFIINRLPT